MGRAHRKMKQRGVTLFGLMFWAIIVGFLALTAGDYAAALARFDSSLSTGAG